MNCDILKSKLIFCEWNALYFIEIAFIGFTLHEIKQCIVFFGTPGSILTEISQKLNVYTGCVNRAEQVWNHLQRPEAAQSMKFSINIDCLDTYDVQ